MQRFFGNIEVAEQADLRGEYMSGMQSINGIHRPMDR
jgi:hypothetical protein